MQEHIFDPYQTTKGTGHSGIGLSLSYEIIKQFNGQITCTSEPWKKTTFTIDLPLTDS
jgi:signal transduction histidine kinase